MFKDCIEAAIKGNPDMTGINLSGESLIGADIRNANLDYSSGIPLHCGGQGATIDDRQAMQFVAHALAFKCDSPWYAEARKQLKDVLKKSHIAKYLDWLKEEECDT